MKALIGIAAVLLAATACSSTPDAQPPRNKVASLATSDAPSPAATAPGRPPVRERPRYRIDMTDQEQQDLYRVYMNCIKDHGVDVAASRQGGPKVDKTKYDAAAKACEQVLPLPAWEEDASNPEALDFAKKVVDCLRGKGVKKVEVSTNEGMVGPAFGGPENDQDSITKGLALTPQCQREVAAAPR
ncbi:hypothetical protein [Actinocrispum sp. NPDC049592]|uniref:hypothetical protein n=1 Tax=Actinocrispum sp. NPDC049592 TaxID=3154835 RepID=UPI00343D1584